MPEDYNLKRVYKKRGITDQFRSFGQRMMGHMTRAMTGGIGIDMLELGDAIASKRVTLTKRGAKKALRRTK